MRFSFLRNGLFRGLKILYRFSNLISLEGSKQPFLSQNSIFLAGKNLPGTEVEDVVDKLRYAIGRILSLKYVRLKTTRIRVLDGDGQKN